MGVIDELSMFTPGNAKEWNKRAPVGSILSARIVFADHANKSIRLSLRPHVLELRSPSGLPPLGAVLENFTVSAVVKRVGVLLSADVEETEGSDVENDDNENMLDTDKKGSRSSKKFAEAQRKQREQDSKRIGAFIQKNSLTAAGPDTDGNDGEDEDEMSEAEADEEEKNSDSGSGSGSDHESSQGSGGDQEADEPRSSSSKISKAQKAEKTPDKPQKAVKSQAPLDLDRDISLATTPEKIESLYKCGNKINSVRVMGYNLVEGWIFGSTLGHHIAGGLVHPSSVTLGAKYIVKVTAIETFGLVVRLGDRVKAVCPLIHTSDGPVSVTTLSKRFKIGQKIAVRVWELKGSQVLVTHKKSLVDNEEEPILSADEMRRGSVCSGVISHVDASKGAIVHFYNRVRAFMPIQLLMKQGVNDPIESLRVGQTMKVIIVRKFFAAALPNKNGKLANNGKRRVRLTAAMDVGKLATILQLADDLPAVDMEGADDDDDDDDEEEIDEKGSKKGGKAAADANADDSNEENMDVEGNSNSSRTDQVGTADFTVMSIEDSKINVRLTDGRLGVLPFDQCYDFASTAAAVFKQESHPFQKGASFRGALIMGIDNKQKTVQLSLKPALLIANETPASAADAVILPKRVTSMQPGQTVAGTVLKVEDFGILVRFCDGMAALCPRPSVSDSFIKTPVGLFQPGDAMRCVVQRVDLARERAILSFKSTVVKPSSGASCYLASLLREQSLVASFSASTAFISACEKMPSGTIVEATVSSIEDYGVVMLCDDGVTMLLAQAPHHVVSHITAVTKKGEKKVAVAANLRVKVCVLDADFENGVLQATMDPALLTTASKSQESAFAAGGTVESRVEIIKEKYLVVSSGRSVGFVMIADYHYPSRGTSGYQTHQTLQVKVTRAANNRKGEEREWAGINMQNLYSGVALLALNEPHGTNGKSANNTVKVSDSVSSEKFEASLRVDSILRWKITSVTPTLLTVEPENGSVLPSGTTITGVVHVSNAIDHQASSDDVKDSLSVRGAGSIESRNLVGPGHPFYELTQGERVLCRVLQMRPDKSNSRKSVTLELLPRKEKGQEENDFPAACPIVSWKGKGSIRNNSLYAASVVRVADTYCVVAVSQYITIKISYTDISSHFDLAKDFATRCYVGQRLVIGTTRVEISDSNGKNNMHIVLASRKRVENLGSEKLVLSSPEARDFLELLKAQAPKPTKKDKKKKEDVAGDASPDSAFTVKVGDLVMGIIDLKSTRKEANHNTFVRVNLPDGQSGRVDITELADPADWVDLSWLGNAVTDASVSPASSKPAKKSKKNSETVAEVLPGGLVHGDLCQVRVIAAGKGKRPEPALSLRSSRISAANITAACVEDSLPEEGASVKAYVSNTGSKGCFLRISRTLTGQVEIRNLADDFVESPEDAFPTGKLVQARVLSVSLERSTAKLTLKSTAVTGTDPIRDAQFSKLSEGQVLTGKIQSIDNAHGVFVAIDNTTLVGLARRLNCTSKSDADLKEMFKVGDVVRAKVISLAQTSKKISLGLKPSLFKDEIDGDSDSGSESVSDDDDDDDDDDAEEEEEEDASSDGSDQSDSDDDDIRMLADGESDDESIENMIKKAALQAGSGSDDDEDSDDDDEEEGMEITEVDHSDDDSVEALVKKAALRDEESASGSESVSDDKDDDSEEEEEEEIVAKGSKRKAVNEKKSKKGKAAKPSDSEDSSSDSEEEAQELFHKPKALKSAQPVESFWGDDFKPAIASINKTSPMEVDSDEEKESGSDSDDDNKGKSRGQKQRAKALEKRREEEDVRSLEDKYSKENFSPKTLQDYERLLIGEPSSSYLWIRYMALHLSLADVDAARAVAERALKAINFRMEDEKYNVFVAYLNLEHDFGDNNSLNTVFKRAIQESKGKYLHLNLADVYEKSDNLAGAEDMYSKALKKYKYSKKVWMAFQHFCLRHDKADQAKALLARSMQSLSRHKHIEVLTKYALAEFDVGSIDRGRVVFEELVSSYPKRTDLLHIYVDKEIKMGYIPQARHLFKRMCSNKLNVHNMKAVLKKFLEFEKKHGDNDGVEFVLSQARDFAASIR